MKRKGISVMHWIVIVVLCYLFFLMVRFLVKSAVVVTTAGK